MTSATTTSVTCITGRRPGLQAEPSLSITIEGYGNVATQDVRFRYVYFWSNPITWGGEFAPIDGDMVYIPAGLHLLVDIDTSPVLSAVVVQGSLIFPSGPTPNHVRSFSAHYIMNNEGYVEAGTEAHPYTSKLIITMHSQREDPELPIYGNKVLATYNGITDLHGIPRHPTWS